MVPFFFTLNHKSVLIRYIRVIRVLFQIVGRFWRASNKNSIFLKFFLFLSSSILSEFLLLKIAPKSGAIMEFRLKGRGSTSVHRYAAGLVDELTLPLFAAPGRDI